VGVVGTSKAPTTKDTKVHGGKHEGLRLLDSKALGHFVIEEAFAGPVRLDPFSVDDKLRDGALAGEFDDFVDGARRCCDIDFFVGNVVLGKKTLGFPTIGAPERGINGEFHFDG